MVLAQTSWLSHKTIKNFRQHIIQVNPYRPEWKTPNSNAYSVNTTVVVVVPGSFVRYYRFPDVETLAATVFGTIYRSESFVKPDQNRSKAVPGIFYARGVKTVTAVVPLADEKERAAARQPTEKNRTVQTPSWEQNKKKCSGIPRLCIRRMYNTAVDSVLLY